MADVGQDDELWGRWTALVRAVPVVRMPLEWFFSPSIWRLFGVDFLSGLLKNRTTADVFAVLQPLQVSDLKRLHALALLNHKRHEAISRWIAIAFLTKFLPETKDRSLEELEEAFAAGDFH